jgi:hypothetical protein
LLCLRDKKVVGVFIAFFIAKLKKSLIGYTVGDIKFALTMRDDTELIILLRILF